MTENNGSSRIWLRRTPLADTLFTVRTALRLFRRHWPVLLALGFLGVGARQLFLAAAVQCGRLSDTAGILVLVLAPLAWMTAAILMLRLVSDSLPWLSIAPKPGEPGRNRAINVIGNVLIPFIAVYQLSGRLHSDLVDYVYAVWRVDPFTTAGVPTKLGVLVVAVIIVAIGLRTALGAGTWAQRWPWLGIIGAYLEVVWITISASAIAWIWSWLGTRRIVAWGTHAVDRVGQIGTPVHWILDRLGGLIDNATTIIGIPVAWLTVAAIVYGREVTAEAKRRDTKLTRVVASRWGRLPHALQRVLEALRDNIRERYDTLATGLRVATRSGLGSILLFCLLFLLANTVSVGLFDMERWLIGPQDLIHVWMPLSIPLDSIDDAVTLVLLSCLIGAAVDRVLSVQPVAAGAAESSAAAPHIPQPRRSPESDQPAFIENPDRQHPDRENPGWDGDTVAVDVVTAQDGGITATP